MMPLASPVVEAAVSDRLGRPLHDLRISVTDRCNFRCTYCMPADVFGERYQFMPTEDLLTFDEIARLAEQFVAVGVTKLRITGGEPLLRTDLPELVEMLAGIEGVQDLALTTNGFLLAQHATTLKAAGLDRVTVSLDSLDPVIFGRMSGLGENGDAAASLARVLEGIDAATAAGLAPIKINCVVQRGVNDDGIVDLARYFKDAGHIVRFIEFMDVGTLNGWAEHNVMTGAEIVQHIHAELPLEPAEANYRGEVAARHRYTDGDGEIGVITSVSDPFCGDCSRARLSADGRLVTCLFATGGQDLRGLLRSNATNEKLNDAIANIWRRRADRYSEERSAVVQTNGSFIPRDRIEMYQIGG